MPDTTRRRTLRSAPLALTVLALALGARAAEAQTRFAWPDSTLDVAEYVEVEECLAAIGRVKEELDRAYVRVGVWRDTMPSDPREPLQPEAPPVTATAARCAGDFTEPAAPVTDFLPLLTLYLAAGRDDDAASLVRRRLEAIGDATPAAKRERPLVIDSAVQVYVGAKPARLDAAEALLAMRVRLATDRIARLKVHAELMGAAERSGDTARARRVAARMVAVADSLTDEERRSEEFERWGGTIRVFGAYYTMLGEQVLMDSLRRSTAGYSALIRAMWTKATGQRAEALPIPIGEPAPAIQGDYWFGRGADSTSPRPARGRVSLVVMVDQAECLDIPMIYGASFQSFEQGHCRNQWATLRRLVERFPSLDVTLVARTRGYFMLESPPPPAEEARLLREWMVAHHLTMPLAVESTDFWRLPAPDRRRIERADPNFDGYTFGKLWKVSGGSLFVVDQDGLIVWAEELGSTGETKLAGMIELLLARHSPES